MSNNSLRNRERDRKHHLIDKEKEKLDKQDVQEEFYETFKEKVKKYPSGENAIVVEMKI